MAYDANGFWKPEDDNVVSQTTGLMAGDSPLIKQARSQGEAAANRRGLLNSSISAGASEGAAYAAAIPLASQQSAQIHAKNMLAQQNVGEKDRLVTAAGLDLTRQNAQNDAEMARLNAAAGYDTQTQIRGINASMAQLQESGRLEQARQDSQNLANLEMQRRGGNIDLAKINLTADRSMEELRMNLASGDRERATGAAVSLLNSQDSLLAAIMGNPDIDAATRGRMLLDNQARRQLALDVVGQLYNVNLVWGGTPAPASNNMQAGI